LLRCPLRSTPFPYTTLFRPLEVDSLGTARRTDRAFIGGLRFTPYHRWCITVPPNQNGVVQIELIRPEGQCRRGKENTCSRYGYIDRKSTRLNSSHVKISYAV